MADKPQAKVGIIAGSESDVAIVQAVVKQLELFDIASEQVIASAHRHPDKVETWVNEASRKSVQVIIAIAGKSAALPGVVASHTTLPVIGVPVSGPDLGGLDALLSIQQMPSGIPVAAVAIDGGKNAAILAAEILALNDAALHEKLFDYRASL